MEQTTNDKQAGTQPPVKPVHVPTKNSHKPSRFKNAATIGLVAIVFFVLGTRAYEIPYLNAIAGKSANSGSLDLSSVQQTYDMLRQNYAGGTLDTSALIDGAKKGLVEATGDPYSVYFTDKEASEFFGDLEGNFSGIGAELEKKNEVLTIVRTIDESPAKKAGLQANDIILKVNDEDVTSATVEEVVSKIRGEKGTTVKLNTLRGTTAQEYTITRDTISTPSVTSEVQDGIGYLRISRFSQSDTGTLSRAAAEQFRSQNVKGVVLDLRGNGGGYVTAAQSVASLWLGQGKTVVDERKGDVSLEKLKTNGSAVLEGVPTIILTDGGTASASEIVAGALKDYKAATLVGEKTYGKGVVQDIKDVPSGGKLKVTVAQWYTPNGKNINKQGIEPDTKVGLTAEDVAANRDTQKDKAFELLK